MNTRVLRILLSLSLGCAMAFASPQATKSASGQSASQAGGKVDLNSASEKDLEGLPGVGAATAKKIIAARPLSSVSDLQKAGVSAKTIDKITPLVTVGGGAASASSPAGATKSSGSASGSITSSKSNAASTSQQTASSGTAAKVDLNSASQKDLEGLPGVGAATAKKIMAARPYSSVDDLSKTGMSKSKIDKLSGLVSVGSAQPASATQPAPAAARAPSSQPSQPYKASQPSQPSSGTTQSSAPASPSAIATKASDNSQTAQQPPQPGMVWANLDSKVYHQPGHRWYGKTKHGQFMTEQDAIKAGFRASKE
ncbi:MAG TPA: helix-hairpin-helix domain-containing protein [Candidatus Saccharimonadales bacterium]|nr:helix-hairpin-helix domain-containing protein [Candidatus Saccharimonadales bacterium]